MENIDVLAILQARVSSSRLPAKVLKPLLGVAMILHQLERIKRAQKINYMIVATSTDKTDDELTRLLQHNGYEVFRGSLNNVLQRFFQAARKYNSRHIVRLTADCPLTDPVLIDNIIEQHLNAGADYTSNIIHRSYPDGLDVEIFTYPTLQRAYQQAHTDYDQEHVTPYILKHPQYFNLLNVQNKQHNFSSLRWTVDTAEDFNFIEQVYKRLFPSNAAFSTKDILQLLNKQAELTIAKASQSGVAE